MSHHPKRITTLEQWKALLADSGDSESLKIRIERTDTGDLYESLGIGEKPGALALYIIEKFGFKVVEGMEPVLRYEHITVQESDYIRKFGYVVEPIESVKAMVEAGGLRIEVADSTEYRRLIDHGIVEVGLEERPPDWVKSYAQKRAWYLSESISLDGFDAVLDGKKYHFDPDKSSTAGKRTGKFMFFNRDLDLSTSPYFTALEASMAAHPAKLEQWKGFSTMEKLYQVGTYGCYGLSVGKEISVAKFAARAGLGLASSKSFGNKYRMAPPHRVVLDCTPEYLANLRSRLIELGATPDEVDATMPSMIAKHKPDVADGQSLIRAEWVLPILKRMGFKKLGIRDILMKTIQGRCAILKGTFIILPGVVMDQFEVSLGVFPYRDYDICPEINSIKMAYDEEVFTGEFAPDFCMMAISAADGSDMSDHQMLQAMSWSENPSEWSDAIDEILENSKQEMFGAMTDYPTSLAFHGLRSRDLTGDGALSPMANAYRSKATAGLAASKEMVHDRWFRQSVLNGRLGQLNHEKRSKISMELVRLRMQGDVMCHFVHKSRQGDKCLELVLDGDTFYELALQNSRTIFCGGMTGLKALARNPLNHPGEIGIVEATDTVMRAQGLYDLSRGIIWVSALDSVLLNQMGGADLDGDIAALISEPKLIAMCRTRVPLVVELDSHPPKMGILCEKTLREDLATSLMSEGIGIITNWASSCWEVYHILRWKLFSKDCAAVESEEYWSNKERCHLVTKLSDQIKTMGDEAVLQLSTRGSTMPAWEKSDCEVIAGLASLPDDPWNETDFPAYAEYVIGAMEAAVRLDRHLQEMSIETAKTGVRVFYDRVNGHQRVGKHNLPLYVEHGRYAYLRIDLRPDWLNSNAKRRLKHHGSPLEYVAKRAAELYAYMQAWVVKDSRPIDDLLLPEECCDPAIWTRVDGILRGGVPGINFGYIRMMNRITNQYRRWGKLKDGSYEEYGIAECTGPLMDRHKHNRWINELGLEQVNDQRREAFASLNYAVRELLFKVMEEYPDRTHLVLMAAYSLAVKSDRSDDSRKASGFAWSTVGDELARLLFAFEAAKGGEHERIVELRQPSDMDVTPPEGEVYVQAVPTAGGHVRYEVKTILEDQTEIVWGTAAVREGAYPLRILCGRPYLIVTTVNESAPRARRLSPVTVRVVGLMANGVNMTRLTELRLSAASKYEGTLLGKQTIMTFARDSYTHDGAPREGMACLIDGVIIGHLSRDVISSMGFQLDGRSAIVSPMPDSRQEVPSLSFRILEEVVVEAAVPVSVQV